MKKTERPYLFCLGLAAAGILILILSLCIGAVPVPPGKVFAALNGTCEETYINNIILYTRIPRVCAGMIAGAALSSAGVVIQSVLSNSLASPHVLGVNAGAGFAVALVLAIFPFSIRFAPAAAFAGALTAVLVVLFISEKAKASKTSLVLAGVAIECIFAAATEAVLLFKPDALAGYTDFRIGGFSGVPMSKLVIPGIAVPVIIIGLLLASHYLDVMMLGTDTAQSLGISVKKARVVFLGAAALLSGLAVSFAGVLGFVGLLVPHLMRRIVGEGSRPLLLASAIGGAILLSACDLLARTLFTPFEIPVGIIMSMIGGPFFIFLVFRRKKRKYD